MVLESLRKIFQSKNPQPIIPAKNSQPLKILKNTLKNPFESNEIILKIFSFLDARELGLVSLVCTNWKKLAADNFLWEPIFKKTFPHSSVSIKTSSEILWKQAYIQAKLSPVKSRSYSIPCNEVSFINGNRFIAFEKGVAVRVYELKSGSLIGEAKNNFLGVALEGDILATYSADKSISIWNIISKKCLFSTNSFLNGQRITYLHLHGNLLFCCSNEREPVEVWDYIKGEKLSSIDTCNKFVSQIETRENLVLLRLEGFQRHQRDSLFLIYDTSLRKCFCKVDCADQSFAAWDFYDDSLYVAAKDKCVV